MKTTMYDHHAGRNALPKEVYAPFLKALRAKNVQWRMKGATPIRKAILSELPAQGWSKRVRLDAEVGITVPAVLEGVVLSLQFGNMSRFYADILKMQYLYTRNRAVGAIYVLPKKEAAEKIGSNIANFERLKRELKLFEDIITMPILVVGVEG